jgi:uncharacterized membrane protein
MKPVHAIFLAVSFFLILAILAAPYIASLGQHGAYAVINAGFAPYCHQRSDRSYFVFGSQFPVCARCLGIYSGMLAGSVFFSILWRRTGIPPGWIIIAASAPMVLDGFTQLLGMRQSTNILRLTTGLVFGMAIPVYLIAIGEELLARRIKQKKQT